MQASINVHKAKEVSLTSKSSGDSVWISINTIDSAGDNVEFTVFCDDEAHQQVMLDSLMLGIGRGQK